MPAPAFGPPAGSAPRPDSRARAVHLPSASDVERLRVRTPGLRAAPAQIRSVPSVLTDARKGASLSCMVLRCSCASLAWHLHRHRHRREMGARNLPSIIDKKRLSAKADATVRVRNLTPVQAVRDLLCVRMISRVPKQRHAARTKSGDCSGAAGTWLSQPRPVVSVHGVTGHAGLYPDPNCRGIPRFSHCGLQMRLQTPIWGEATAFRQMKRTVVLPTRIMRAWLKQPNFHT